MNTITIDSNTYRAAQVYAKQQNMSVEDLVEHLLGQIVAQSHGKAGREYYISPKIESLRVGFKCPEGSSFDYKKELRDILTDKYLLGFLLILTYILYA